MLRRAPGGPILRVAPRGHMSRGAPSGYKFKGASMVVGKCDSAWNNVGNAKRPWNVPRRNTNISIHVLTSKHLFFTRSPEYYCSQAYHLVLSHTLTSKLPLVCLPKYASLVCPYWGISSQKEAPTRIRDCYEIEHTPGNSLSSK